MCAVRLFYIRGTAFCGFQLHIRAADRRCPERFRPAVWSDRRTGWPWVSDAAVSGLCAGMADDHGRNLPEVQGNLGKGRDAFRKVQRILLKDSSSESGVFFGHSSGMLCKSDACGKNDGSAEIILKKIFYKMWCRTAHTDATFGGWMPKTLDFKGFFAKKVFDFM